ncbi:DUF4255 domain-containing protein [Tropicimonas sp. TH_r6]|uniref:DUF4255 domain-containing protein n=1 Tax=Tropicimonas sp. TH_r6 TaxID=3082085 RepID=UPI0029551480|nr:DUF4255 domain-containing protein [Tropicimonas sp. TH_r6]MDV7144038.1 DUF4255 domain-containing protein [Tropicimonas sp. TH_r6]
MIGDALEYVRRELRTHLDVSDGEVRIDSARSLNEAGPQGALITLLNIEEEAALRNTRQSIELGGSPHYREPSVFMNIYLLFSFDFIDYGACLLNLSRTIEMFQHRRFLSAANANPALIFPSGIERLIFEHHNMSFEALNNVWSVLGGEHYPSVIYKVRLLELRDVQPTVEADAITRIDLETVRR